MQKSFASFLQKRRPLCLCPNRAGDETHLNARSYTVGLISDTHGLLRPEALDLLRGSDFIVHAGDIGNAEILVELARLAPVSAVRGNVDTGAWAQSLPETEVLAVGEVARVYVLHAIDDLDLDPAAAGFHVVVSGHSHKPGFHRKNGVLYVTQGAPARAASPCPSRWGGFAPMPIGCQSI